MVLYGVVCAECVRNSDVCILESNMPTTPLLAGVATSVSLCLTQIRLCFLIFVRCPFTRMRTMHKREYSDQPTGELNEIIHSFFAIGCKYLRL